MIFPKKAHRWNENNPGQTAAARRRHHGNDGDLDRNDGAFPFCALAMGNQGELASAALDGAASAIELGISMAGVLCLWMG